MADGPQIDGFENLTLIGRGASGTVYRAHQSAMNRDVAIKILSATTTDPHARERFGREVRALGNLSGHPNIVTVYTSGTTSEDQPYLVMGLMASDITSRIPSPERDAIELIRQVAKGLQEAHDGGVLHRDIKPANIFVDRYGSYRLGDFGLVGLSDTATMTQSSVGSPAYMAPELLGNTRASQASDLYALGVTLYELIEGVLPFRMGSGGIAALLHTIASAAPAPTQIMSPALAAFVHRCLAKDPALRPQTVTEFLAGLDDAAAGRMPPPVAATPPPTASSTPVTPVAPLAATSAAPPDPSTRSDPGAVSGDPAVAASTSGPMTVPGTSSGAGSFGTASSAASASTPPGVTPPLAAAASGGGWGTTSGPGPTTSGGGGGSTRWVLLGLGAVALLVLAGVAVFALGGGDDEPDPPVASDDPETGVLRLEGETDVFADDAVQPTDYTGSVFLVRGDGDDILLIGDSYTAAIGDLTATSSDGSEVDLELVGVSECANIAVYEASSSDVEERFVFEWANSALTDGDEVTIAGFDEGEFRTRPGTVDGDAAPSTLRFADFEHQLLIAEATVAPGMFGGPVLDDRDRVGAVLLNRADAGAQAIAADEAEAAVEAIVRDEGWVTGLGISPDGNVEIGGVRAYSVVPDSPAAQAGVQAGDVITEIDGASMVNPAASAIANYCAATQGVADGVVPITVQRGELVFTGAINGAPLAPEGEDPPPGGDDIPTETLFSPDSALLVEVPAGWESFVDEATADYASSVLSAQGVDGRLEVSHQPGRGPAEILDLVQQNYTEAGSCAIADDRHSVDTTFFTGTEASLTCDGVPGHVFAGTNDDGQSVFITFVYDGSESLDAVRAVIYDSVFYNADL